MNEYPSADSAMASIVSHVLHMGQPITTRNATVRRGCLLGAEFSRTPLVSLRKTAWKTALREWEWFMSGSADVDNAHPDVRRWWQPWANCHGLVPNNYSWQFRDYGEKDGDERKRFDQIAYLIDGVKNHPFGRRNVITTWHTQDMADPETPITNCHGTVIQAFVDPATNALSLFTYQRSADLICGVPHNWIQYWAFLVWLAHRTGREVGRLSWLGGDVHIYPQHEDVAERMVKLWNNGDLSLVPGLIYTPTTEDFRADDFTLSGQYAAWITEKVEMVV